jgi:hypothetical protein
MKRLGVTDDLTPLGPMPPTAGPGSNRSRDGKAARCLRSAQRGRHGGTPSSPSGRRCGPGHGCEVEERPAPSLRLARRASIRAATRCDHRPCFRIVDERVPSETGRATSRLRDMPWRRPFERLAELQHVGGSDLRSRIESGRCPGAARDGTSSPRPVSRSPGQTNAGSVPYSCLFMNQSVKMPLHFVAWPDVGAQSENPLQLASTGGKFEDLTVGIAGVSVAKGRGCFADSPMHR